MPKDQETEEVSDEGEESETEETDKEKGLEEEIEEPLSELGDFNFQEFIQPIIETSAPVLERIAGPQGTGFSLSGFESISNPNITEAGGEDDPFKYSAGGGQEEAAKYISSEHMAAPPSQVDFRKVGIRENEVNQEALFTQSSELRDMQSPAQEKYEYARRIDIDSAGRKDPSESEERKYDPKLPSS